MNHKLLSLDLMIVIDGVPAISGRFVCRAFISKSLNFEFLQIKRSKKLDYFTLGLRNPTAELQIEFRSCLA